MNSTKIIIAVMLISLCLIASVAAQEMEYVSSTLHHNPYNSIGKAGEYVYCAGENGIHIFDITDPANPELIQICDFPRIYRMYIDGDYAYLSSRSGTHGLRVLDISNPLDPQIVGNLNFYLSGYAWEIYYNSTIYVTAENIDTMGTGYSTISVIDISDPFNPAVSDSIRLGYLTVDMWAADGYLNVTEQEFDFWWNHWHVFSLTDPAHPAYHSFTEYDLYNYVDRVWGYENYSYVQVNDSVLIYDISMFDNPVLVRTESYEEFPDFVSMHDTIGFARLSNGIRTYSMSDPLFPSLISNLFVPNGFSTFFHGGDTCYTARILISEDDASKFNIIDFTDIFNPSVIGEYWTDGKTYDVQLRGDYAYIANGSAGLTVVDINDPLNPIVFYSSISNDVADIFIYGNRAYILAGTAYFGICDISNPIQPVLLGYHSESTGRVKNVYVEGGYAYVVKVPYNNPHGGFIAIYDISDPANPTPAYSIENLYFPRNIITENGYAYISCRDDLEIYDVSNLDSISMIGSYPYQNSGYQFAVNQQYLYLACNNTALEVINISDPANPYIVGDYDSLSTRNIMLNNNYALLKNYHGLYLMDVSDPENPNLISSYMASPFWYSTEEAQLRDQYIYVPGYSRFEILRLTPTGIEEIGSVSLNDYSLPQNYPNPFNASTTISFSLPEPADIRVEIFDILGRRVETLFSGPQKAGEHSVNWNPGNISSGVYYYRVESKDYRQSKSCLLVK